MIRNISFHTETGIDTEPLSVRSAYSNCRVWASNNRRYYGMILLLVLLLLMLTARKAQDLQPTGQRISDVMNHGYINKLYKTKQKADSTHPRGTIPCRSVGNR